MDKRIHATPQPLQSPIPFRVACSGIPEVEIGGEPAYLSKIERGDVGPPSEATTIRLAQELGEDPDVLLALGGKVSVTITSW